MSTLREQLAHDLTKGDMSGDESSETALDRIGALARVDPLGAALWRLTSDMNVSSLRDAMQILAMRTFTGKMVYVETVVPHIYSQVAQAALQAWLSRAEGTGVEEIMRVTGLSPVSRDKFDAAYALILAADARVERQLGYQLGHKTPSKPLRRKAKPKLGLH